MRFIPSLASFVFTIVSATGALSMPAPTFGPKVSNAFRIRVAQLRTTTFSMNGSDLKIGPKKFAGFHAFKLERKGDAWTVRDRDSAFVLVVYGPSLSIDGTDVRLNLKAVPGRLQINAHGGAKTDVIATLDLETYLRGVLPSEMPASWPLESLKAQAVAARTFALYRRAHRAPGADFDLDSDVSDQMFQNPLTENETSVPLVNVERAIRETRGQVLEDAKSTVFAAYFHADCGGRTEEAREVWGSGEKMGVAIDGGCPLNPRATWTLKMSMASLSAKLARALKRTGSVVSLADGGRTGSHRLAALKVAWNDGTTTTVPGNEFRAALGYDQLRSTQFDFTRTGAEYLFKGHGYGHGVGLCQWGARQMAKAGRGYREILAHYYPRAKLMALDRDDDLNDKEGDRAEDKQVAQFHKVNPL